MGKNRQFIMIALVLFGSLFVGLVVYMLLGKLQPRPVVVAEKPAAKQTDMVSILVANRDIDVGEATKIGDLVWRAWPRSAVNPSYFVQEDDPKILDTLTGLHARIEISKDEPVLLNKLVKTGESSSFLPVLLKEGMRAVSIPISDSSAVSGFILPGDHVDILMTYQEAPLGGMRARSAGKSVTDMVFENIRVLAIGQVFSGKDKTTVIGSTATLEMTLEQAKNLESFLQKGQLNLVLRSLTSLKKKKNEKLYSSKQKRKTIKIHRSNSVSQIEVLQ